MVSDLFDLSILQTFFGKHFPINIATRTPLHYHSRYLQSLTKYGHFQKEFSNVKLFSDGFRLKEKKRRNIHSRCVRYTGAV